MDLPAWITPAGVWTAVGLIFYFGRRLQALEMAAEHAMRVPQIEQNVAVLTHRVDDHAEDIAEMKGRKVKH